MDLLASYSSGDSGDESNASALPEDSVSAAKNVSAHPTTAPSESDDSDCSDDDAKAAKANASIKNGATNSRKKSVLPSVDDLFANSSGPSFLAAAKTEEPICYTKKRKVEDVAPTADPKTASSSAASISTPAPVIQKTKPTVRIHLPLFFKLYVSSYNLSLFASLG